MTATKTLAILFVGAAGLAGLAVGPRIATAGAQEEYAVFQSPSGNTHCFVSSEFASCEVRVFNGKVPPRPVDCDLDWVPGASVNTKGRVSAFSCQGDTNVSPGSLKLAYGKSVKRGPFTCASSASGITCTLKSGRGFLASRMVIRKF